MPKIMKAHMRQPRISKHLVKHHIFCTIDSSVENSEQELIKQLKELARQRDELNQDSPPISSWAHKKAQKVIKDKAIKNQVDSEADSVGEFKVTNR